MLIYGLKGLELNKYWPVIKKAKRRGDRKWLKDGISFGSGTLYDPLFVFRSVTLQSEIFFILPFL